MTIEQSCSGGAVPAPWVRKLTGLLSRLAVSAPDGTTFDELAAATQGLSGSSSACVTMCGPHSGWLRVAAASGAEARWRGRLIPVEGSLSAMTRRRDGAMRLTEASLDGWPLQSARSALVGPAMITPLYGLDGSWDGALLVGRPIGGRSFTDMELRNFTAYSARVWAVVSRAAQRGDQATGDRVGRDDDLVDALRNVVDAQLEPARASLAAIEADLPVAARPALRRVLSLLDQARHHLTEPVGRAVPAGGDPLLTHLLHVCDVVVRPLQLVEHFVVAGELPDDLPDIAVTRIGRVVAAALLLADHYGCTRGVEIHASSTIRRQLVLTVTYTGRIPEPGSPAQGTLTALTAQLGGRPSFTRDLSGRVRTSWTSDPLAREESTFPHGDHPNR